MHVDYAKHRPKRAKIPDPFAKERAKQRNKARRDAWALEIKQLREKAKQRAIDRFSGWKKGLLPIIEITETQEFRDFYKNRTGSDWSHEFTNSEYLFELFFTKAKPWLTDQEFYSEKAYQKSLKFNGLGLLEAWQRRWKRQVQATPVWVDKKAIKQIEIARDVMNFLYPEEAPWHVDHIIPLQGENVCGLHVHENMQLLPMLDNIRKNNKHLTSEIERI